MDILKGTREMSIEQQTRMLLYVDLQTAQLQITPSLTFIILLLWIFPEELVSKFAQAM